MRVTSADVPRRPLGLRGWLIGAAVVLVILLLSLRGLARFYTDYLWFKEVGFGEHLAAPAVRQGRPVADLLDDLLRDPPRRT